MMTSERILLLAQMVQLTCIRYHVYMSLVLCLACLRTQDSDTANMPMIHTFIMLCKLIYIWQKEFCYVVEPLQMGFFSTYCYSREL